tara:strand:+ start:3083 stop:4474 length:1392 start_codon:yes stop_codon:yes gene_type:complete
MSNHQLAIPLDSTSEIPVGYDDYAKQYKFRRFPNYPVLHWPNGVPCVEANLFIMDGLLSKSWSIAYAGGTVGNYASNLSHIIRYCYNNNIHFTELTDNRIELFVNGLLSEKKNNGKRKRNNTTVNKIGRDTLKFLIFVGKKLRDKNFIGTKGCRVNYTEEVYKRNGITRIYVTHSVFPSKDPYKRRLPIALSDIEKLIVHITTNSEKSIATRDLCLVKALKATGGRRTEVANLRVSDIDKALASEDSIPMLRLITLKQRKNLLTEIVREVPVYRATLRSIKRYIRKIRARIIKGIEKNTNESFDDHGYVFISETSGEQLKPDSITTYFNTWGKVIGASGNVMSHAFRHFYITEKIEMLIKLFELRDASDVKAKFANENSFKMKLIEWTGHKSVRSLENYIHLAFDDLSGVSASFDKLAMIQGVQVAKDEMNDLKRRIAKKEVSSAEVIVEIDHLINELTDILN